MFRSFHRFAFTRIPYLIALALLFALSPVTSAQLRIATWNVTNYNGGKQSDIKTVVYGAFNGRSLSPDVLLCQEFLSNTAVNDFRTALNTAAGSPGDWASATFVDGADTDSAFFYRTSKVRLLQYVVVSQGSGTATNQPRNIMRYDIEIKGYVNTAPHIACYSTHMKAGSQDNDIARRLIEAEKVRNNAETLPADWSFLIGGDFNIPDSFEAAYVALVGSQTNNRGRFFDPINTPGDWNNNYDFHIVHSQDPATQMDDRFDQLLVSSDLIDGAGMDYIGHPNIPFSTTTWNDPNHSYRTWGNDGSNYNGVLRTTGNTMIGPAIAQSLINLASGNGHIPVFLDLRLPEPLSSVAGIVSLQGCANAAQPLTFEFRPVSGGQNVVRTATLTPSGSFSFSDIPSADYTLAIKGAKWLRQTVAVHAANANVTTISVLLPAGDANDDNFVDVLDLDDLIKGFDALPGDAHWNVNADLNGDGAIDVFDLDLLIQNFDLVGSD